MRPWSLLLLAAAVAGCGGGDPVARPTVTVTETVTREPSPTPVAPDVQQSPGKDPERLLELTVHTDGCGVIRTETSPGLYRNLTWVVRDADGFQVLGRNAEGETRYRYFRPGRYTVTLEAWGEGTRGYVPVSNTVEISC